MREESWCLPVRRTLTEMSQPFASMGVFDGLPSMFPQTGGARQGGVELFTRILRGHRLGCIQHFRRMGTPCRRVVGFCRTRWGTWTSEPACLPAKVGSSRFSRLASVQGVASPWLLATICRDGQSKRGCLAVHGLPPLDFRAIAFLSAEVVPLSSIISWLLCKN